VALALNGVSMKSFLILLSIFSISTSHAQSLTPPHMDLEMTSAEYSRILKNLKKNAFFSFRKSKAKTEDDIIIDSTIELGTRLSSWIDLVNQNRSPDQAIRLTSAQTRQSFPIDKPRTSNPKIIQSKLNAAMTALPQEMRNILTGAMKPTPALPLSDAEFIKLAREIDTIYQGAARYKTLDVWRSHYVKRAYKDVRGYYFLKENSITAQTLENLNSMPEEMVKKISDALKMICLNSTEDREDCEEDFNEALQGGKLPKYYSKYIGDAKENWDSFFKIPKSARRSDVKWFEEIMTVPFNTPEIAKFIPYLRDNIQDEFRFKGWGILVNFGDYKDGPRLIFKAGEVPHVNELGGNEIVMDSVQPIEEYESQWTIRHEFGHVLGLPDCYHEFYDEKIGAYINYQLDTSDLMCSRAGNMKERIYSELKEAYAY